MSAVANFDDIKDDMAFLESWEDRMAYVIDLGKAMAPLAPAECNDLTRVEGCASQVWIVPQKDGGKLNFRGGSDAMIVQGLIAVLLARVNDLTADEILALDIKGDFDKIGLASHLSGQRSNGLTAMINRIQQIATKAQS